MVTLSDQIFLSLCLPLDTKLSNSILVENNIVVENSADYLIRVDINSRYLGMQINWLSPSGVYEINDFLDKIKSSYFTLKTFSFQNSILDTGLAELKVIEIDEQLSDISENPVQNKAITTVLNQILSVIAEPPVYSSPVVSITNVTQTVEYGQNLSGTITISFTQNDAGSITSYSLLRNSIPISSNQSTSFNESDIQQTITYQGTVCYEEGVTKNNNLDIPDPTGKILAGCTNSAIRTITPMLKYFWGASSSIPESSLQVRSLSNNTFSNVSQITLATGTTLTNFVVATPNTKSITSVIDTSNLNANITANYVLINNSFQVVDAGGTLKSYKLYVMSTSVPYSSSANHLITIS